MTLKSALEDVKETTLAAVNGLLGKLAYLASLRRGQGRYEHWGMEMVHGVEASERALKTAHGQAVADVLRAPLQSLEQDLRQTSENQGVSTAAFVQDMRAGFGDLLPGESRNSAAARHLSSILDALSSLEKNRKRATRSTS